MVVNIKLCWNTDKLEEREHFNFHGPASRMLMKL